jgi:hypothetical protein
MPAALGAQLPPPRAVFGRDGFGLWGSTMWEGRVRGSESRACQLMDVGFRGGVRGWGGWVGGHCRLLALGSDSAVGGCGAASGRSLATKRARRDAAVDDCGSAAASGSDGAARPAQRRRV